MKKLTQKELNKVLDLHKKWLNDEEGGQRADLSGTDLGGADLSGADLRGTDLIWAYLSGADLSGTDLSGANLSGAVLSGADLSGTDLREANLRLALFEDANLTNAKLPDFQIPQGEDLIVWKKIEENTLVKLKIPKEAKRTGCLRSNKCRAEYAEVLEIIGEGRRSKYDETFIYEAGNVVKPDSYDSDVRQDCQPGIHFFMTKEEAEKYL